MALPIRKLRSTGTRTFVLVPVAVGSGSAGRPASAVASAFSRKVQNTYFSANCMMRGSRMVTTRPKVGLASETS